jgi:glycerophosphoryl diester phosphodiesterase
MLIIGHRGCHYKGYNQNTIRAYKKVVSEGAKAFEMDVQLTADNELIVVHNLDLTKVSNGIGLVREKTLAELENLWAGNIKEGKDKIPQLFEVYNLIASYKKEKRPTLHLELKGDGTGHPSAVLLKESYLDKGLINTENVLVSSFNWNELKEFKSVIPNINIALLDGSIRRKKLLELIPDGKQLFSTIFAYGEEDYMIPKTSNLEKCILYYKSVIEDKEILAIIINEVTKCLTGNYYTDTLIEEAIKMKAYSVNLWSLTVDGSFIEKCHKKGLKVLLYTVNNPEELEVMKKIQPDGIFTDDWASTSRYMKE